MLWQSGDAVDLLIWKTGKWRSEKLGLEVRSNNEPPVVILNVSGKAGKIKQWNKKCKASQFCIQ